ncbi:hypothetical protein RZS08_09275, partial [Arthrospira platensis SPKY1]|nr:hypothetical protein [Arthrospira platensis SPKY1]
MSVNNRINVALGNKSCTIADMTFDSSYPFGGEDISLMNLFGFYQADSMMIEPKDGYKFVYDSTTGKVKAYIQAPLIVYDEKVDIDSTTNQGTLKYPPAFIMNVSKPAVTVKLRSPGLTTTTLGSNE